jgi:hypothetical protein
MKWRGLPQVFLASIFALYPAMTTHAKHLTKPNRIRFRLVSESWIVVPVLLNGQGPYEVILDTGANATFVDQEIASQLNLPVLGARSGNTLLGAPTLSFSTAGLTLGGRELGATPVLIQDLVAVRRIDPKIRGMIGWDVLSRVSFVIDYARRQIRLSEPSFQERFTGERISYTNEQGMLLVPVLIPRLSKERLRMVLDSGASEILLFSRQPEELDSVRDREASVVDAAGDHTLGFVKIPSVTIGSRTLGGLSAGFMNSGPKFKSFADGIVPARLFHSVYFDNMQRCVILDPGGPR